jgi:hypothetical protein
MADEAEVDALIEAGLGEDLMGPSGGGGGALAGGGEDDDPTFLATPPRFLSSHRLVLSALAISAALSGLVFWVVTIVERHEGLP